jgi:hypothetical protein
MLVPLPFSSARAVYLVTYSHRELLATPGDERAVKQAPSRVFVPCKTSATKCVITVLLAGELLATPGDERVLSFGNVRVYLHYNMITSH